MFILAFFSKVTEEQLISLLEQVSKATEKTTKVNVSASMLQFSHAQQSF
jgi:hypothetical protein